MAGVWSEYNITVNAICPGYYMTDINKDYVHEHPDFYEDSLKQIPLKKWGEPDDIGDIDVYKRQGIGYGLCDGHEQLRTAES